ncbi:MAG: serine/threonine-protein kinase [Anaerolineales bacterium]
MEDLTGKQFGHYQIVAPLGEGGMAAVYKAYQPSMERHVAIKVLPRHMSTSEEFVTRFRREAKLLAQLQHPHILPVFDYGEAEGYPYIVMPFVQSGTLADLIRNKPLSLSETREIIIQIGKALGYAHSRGMIHRDIKPSNVLIDDNGNCLLTDFGLARMLEASTRITASDTVMGTPAYMSPEQGAGSNVDQRSDIYSLGIILYEMVTGRVPYTAETPVAIVFKHIQDPLPSARKLNPSLPKSVETVLLKALAKSPEDRYQTADEFVRAIQRAIPEGEVDDGAIAQTSRSAPPASFNSFSSQGSSASRITTNPKRSGALPWTVAGFGIVGLFSILAILGIVLGAKFFQTPGAGSTETQAVVPTDSPAPAATLTPQPILLATDISPTNPDVFQDDFVDQLAEGWTWLKRIHPNGAYRQNQGFYN